MKVLATLALIATGLTLSSCACKSGQCSMGKKKTSECCSAGTAKKGATGSCCH